MTDEQYRGILEVSRKVGVAYPEAGRLLMELADKVRQLQTQLSTPIEGALTRAEIVDLAEAHRGKASNVSEALLSQQRMIDILISAARLNGENVLIQRANADEIIAEHRRTHGSHDCTMACIGRRIEADIMTNRSYFLAAMSNEWPARQDPI